MLCGDRVQQQWQHWRTRNSEPLAFFLDGARSPERIIFLGASLNGPAEKRKCASLFIVARDDANADGPRLPRIRANTKKLPNRRSCLFSMAPRMRSSCSRRIKPSGDARNPSVSEREVRAGWCPSRDISRSLGKSPGIQRYEIVAEFGTGSEGHAREGC